MRLGVNIDHVATLRNARGEAYPHPAHAAQEALAGGADLITCHLRYDERHIRRSDLQPLRDVSPVLNLEIAVERDALNVAHEIQPDWVCLVPEKREEVTTEGGLNLQTVSGLKEAVAELQADGMKVSLFVEADEVTMERAAELGADAVELHTGRYANLRHFAERDLELNRLAQAALRARNLGLAAHAGHGLTLENLARVAQIGLLEELNIGHAIVCDALFHGGLRSAVQAYVKAIGKASARATGPGHVVSLNRKSDQVRPPD